MVLSSRTAPVISALKRWGLAWILMALLLGILPACQPQGVVASVDLGKTLRRVEAAQGGWIPLEEPRFYTKDNLYDLMNGQSDAFFVYGFEKVGAQRFKGANGAELIVSVFQVDSPDSAYGLFSANRDPQPVTVGNEGSGSPGQRLSFWQDRYFVQMTALQKVDDAELQSVGQAIADAFPKGGKTPAVMSRLPKENQINSPMFFHQELSIQDRVWLGGENKLGLGLDTKGALGTYKIGDKTTTLLVIEYPEVERASAGLQATQSGGLDELLAAKASGKYLVLAFGLADSAQAEALVDAALK